MIPPDNSRLLEESFKIWQSVQAAYMAAMADFLAGKASPETVQALSQNLTQAHQEWMQLSLKAGQAAASAAASAAQNATPPKG